MDDLISILLPLHNAEKTLNRCIESILGQSCENFELIAVDDGSDDSSASILRGFAENDLRIKIFSFQQNRGIVAALNYGLEKCQGEWIARMDADDIMHPDRLGLQLSHFQDHPETDILGARVKIFREKGNLSPGQVKYQDWSNSLLTDQEIKTDIFAESPVMHPTFFLRKSFYKKMNGYHDSPWAEDYDFLLRAYLLNAIFSKLPQVLVEKGDSPLRLARTDIRCKRKAMFQAKAHFFAKKASSFLENKDNIIIAGSGSSGKMACSALALANVKTDAFVDNIPGGPDRTVVGLPAVTLLPENAEFFFRERKNTFFLLCIGVPEGRVMMENLLEKYGFRVVKDYLRFI